VDEIVAHDGKAVAVQGDVAKAQDVVRLFRETQRAFGAPSILVNNAGVFRFEPLEAVSEAEFHREFDTNVLGPILLTQEAAKHFASEGGSVINISSVVSVNPLPGSVVYSATKAALDSVTRTLALELAPRNIRVNSINPGYTETEGATRTGIFEGENGKLLALRTPLGRLGRPEDIAPAAVFLASDAAAWITGESVRVAGGVQHG
jgi:3-oxoacyl-[acyl-carrier protein] reductase